MSTYSDFPDTATVHCLQSQWRQSIIQFMSIQLHCSTTALNLPSAEKFVRYSYNSLFEDSLLPHMNNSIREKFEHNRSPIFTSSAFALASYA